MRTTLGMFYGSSCGDSLLNVVESPGNMRNRGKMMDWHEGRRVKED